MAGAALYTTIIPAALLSFNTYLVYVGLFERNKKSFRYFLYQELMKDEVNSFVLWGATAIAFLLRFISA